MNNNDRKRTERGKIRKEMKISKSYFLFYFGPVFYNGNVWNAMTAVFGRLGHIVLSSQLHQLPFVLEGSALKGFSEHISKSVNGSNKFDLS